MDDEGSYTVISYVLLYSHTVQTRQRFICKTWPPSYYFITVIQCGYRNRRRRRYVFTAAASTLSYINTISPLLLWWVICLWLGCVLTNCRSEISSLYIFDDLKHLQSLQLDDRCDCCFVYIHRVYCRWLISFATLVYSGDNVRDVI